MISNMLASMQAISYKHHFAGQMMNANQRQLALLNQASPNMTPVQRNNLYLESKALDLQAVQAKVMFQAAQAMQERADKMLEEDFKRQQRLNRYRYD